MRQAALVLVFIWIGCFFSSAESVQNVSSEGAFEMVKQADTYLVDVRSLAEYVFVGHPEMAYNIPLMFWNEARAKMENNEQFIQDLLDQFHKNDRLIFLCRSGGRSARAAKMAQKSGFTEVFNVKKGFEGDKNAEGYRTVNGWRNKGLPYTYALDQELIYTKRQ
jgi:rhodanese-related sulfurtransferase